ncbi:MAG: cupredoxin family copper-binding protein [Candidatus Buchananbacteria bacterium]
MRKISLILFISLFLLFGCTLSSVNPTTGQNPPLADQTTTTKEQNLVQDSQTVLIKDFTFTPQTLTVKAGSTVKWINNDTVPHIISGKNFKSETLNQGDSFSYTFTQAGDFSYLCGIHTYMKGKIIVE